MTVRVVTKCDRVRFNEVLPPRSICEFWITLCFLALQSVVTILCERGISQLKLGSKKLLTAIHSLDGRGLSQPVVTAGSAANVQVASNKRSERRHKI